MNNILTTYRALLVDAKEHLSQNFSSSSRRAVSEDLYTFFNTRPSAPPPEPYKEVHALSAPPQHRQQKVEETKTNPSPTHAKEAPPAQSSSLQNFALEKSPDTGYSGLAEVKELFSHLFDGEGLVDLIPDDSIAKTKKTPAVPMAVVILFGGCSADDHEFLNNVAKAINDTLAPAALFSCDQIEALWGWGNFFNDTTLRYVVACASSVNQKLASYCATEGMVGRATLIPLEKISRYHTDITLKKSLWKTLRTVITR